VELVDTNVLLYAVSSDPEDHVKALAAIEILRRRSFALSAQVLQEFYWQATRASRRHRLTSDEALSFIRPLLESPIQDVTPTLVLGAVATAVRFQISYWDAAVIEAARELGCDTVLSEDLDHGGDYGGVRVENPFRNL
jgi:predicted nucleic acid-binding protein